MHLLPFVTIWDTTLNEAFFKKYFIKKKSRENQKEKVKEKGEEKKMD